MRTDAAALRSALHDLVHWSDCPREVPAGSCRQEIDDGLRIETITLDGAPPFLATLLLPDGPGPFPAVLYCHAHGGDYALGRRELLEGARWLDGPLGRELVSRGFAVFAIDAMGFGDRHDEWTESASAKALFWTGKSLFGRMLGDLRGALGYLAARSEIDDSRIFTFGVSMGAAHAWWLAALDERVAGTAHAVMLADIADLFDGAVHDRHGLYYVVPGLLTLCDQGDVAGLVAPRPQFVAHGALDHLAPDSARRSALVRLRAAYEGADDKLETFLDLEAGHCLSTKMHEAAMNFLSRHATTNERISP